MRGGPSDDMANYSLDADRQRNDLFGIGSDVVVKYVLEGHERGVNWASFHPTQQMIVSGADDRSVKLWRMSDSKAWEIDTLRGHTNNVSSVLFHPKHDLVISNSEDRTIRVWDLQKRVCIHTFRRENERFWILASHAEHNLLASGHDGGMIVFKLERERPAFSILEGMIVYARDRQIRHIAQDKTTDTLLCNTVARPNTPILGSGARSLHVNPFSSGDELQILTTYAAENGSYDFFSFQGGKLRYDAQPTKGSFALGVAFTGRTKYAVLERSAQRKINVHTFVGNDQPRAISPPYPNADMIFPASVPGRILVRADDRICLFELQSRRLLAELTGIQVKYVVWSQNGSMVALFGKHNIVIADKDLTQISNCTETVRVKGGVFDKNGVFIYATLNHIKYLLPIERGESGVICSIEAPIYPIEMKDNTLYVMTRSVRVKQIAIDPTEYLFKLALARKKFGDVMRIIKSGRLCGQSVVAFLHRAGYPEIALLFVEDPRTRFQLAINCGNLEIAHRSAKAVNSEDTWSRLAEEALKHGAVDIAESAYQTVESIDKLSTLYAIMGNKEKLQKMVMVANIKKDPQSRFTSSLLANNAAERVRVLESSGQIALAYVAAVTAGLTEQAQELKGYLETAGLPIPEIKSKYGPLTPCEPVKPLEGNLPRYDQAKPKGLDLAAIAAAATIEPENEPADSTGLSAAARAAAAAAQAVAVADAQEEEQRRQEEEERRRQFAEETKARLVAQQSQGGWDDDLDLEPAALDLKQSGGAGWNADLDLDLEFDAMAPQASTVEDDWGMPVPGTSLPAVWAKSRIPGELVAAGSFESAMEILHRQLGFKNFLPLRQKFKDVYLGCQFSLPSLPDVQSHILYSATKFMDNISHKILRVPFSGLQFNVLANMQDRLHSAFTKGEFVDAMDLANQIFQSAPLISYESTAEVEKANVIVKSTSELRLALRCIQESRAGAEGGQPARQLHAIAMSTFCKLSQEHLLLTLSRAMFMAYKYNNFLTAIGFARRLLEVPLSKSPKYADMLAKTNRVIQLSEAQGKNALPVSFDENTSFHICAATLDPIAHHAPHIRVPYSGAYYQPKFKGQICVIDGMSEIGSDAPGSVDFRLGE